LPFVLGQLDWHEHMRVPCKFWPSCQQNAHSLKAKYVWKIEQSNAADRYTSIKIYLKF